MLADAADAALEVARNALGDDLAPQPPMVLRPILGWRRGTRTVAARAAALAALEDEGFRARVADVVADDSWNEASRLFLRRPDGWQDELVRIETHAVNHAARFELEEVRAELVVEREARRRVATESEELRRELSVARGTIEQLRADLSESRSEAERRQAVAVMLTEQRLDAVRDLKAVEKRLAARTQELRAVQAKVERAEVTDVGPPPDADLLETLRRRQLGIAARYGELGAMIDALAVELAIDAGTGAALTEKLLVPERRVPLQLGRGLTSDTPAGVAWLLARPGVQVLVDGYNVTMLAWPTLSAMQQRDRLDAGCRSLAASTGASIAIVYDGIGDGGVPARRTGSDVRVLFAPEHSEADDEILLLIPSIPIQRPLVVVSNDRRVLDGARDAGANTTNSTAFAELLRR